VDVRALLLAYASGVKSAIVQHKAYPSVAERLGHEGSAKVGFTLSRDGSLDAVVVRESSGFDELDQAAVAAVRAAAPFDPLPGESGRDTLTLTITLKFSLGS
jgi:protein TonB